MTGYITMFDTIDEAAWPADPQAVLGYVDGHVGDQPDWAWVQKRFPRAFHLSIALSPSHDAMALDIETGAASPSSAAAWYERQKARGVGRPCLYASASLLEATIIPIVRAARIPRESVRLWSAHYTHVAHICGPTSCGLTSIAVDGTQWTNRAYGRNLDQSLLLPDFFGTAPKPPVPPPSVPTWQERMMQALPTLKQGDKGPAVARAQALVNESRKLRGEAFIAQDGDFGAVTATAVREEQAHGHITQDGTVGPQTWPALLGIA